MTPLFHLENIVRTYPDPASRDPHAVRTVLNLSELDIRAGEILGIRGHNGSGKSTLLRIIALLEPPDSGTVLFEGRPAGTDDLHLRRQVTLLLQTPYLLSRSVASNVAYGLRVRGIRNASELQNRIAASLLAVGLDPAVLLHRRPAAWVWYDHPSTVPGPYLVLPANKPQFPASAAIPGFHLSAAIHLPQRSQSGHYVSKDPPAQRSPFFEKLPPPASQKSG